MQDSNSSVLNCEEPGQYLSNMYLLGFFSRLNFTVPRLYKAVSANLFLKVGLSFCYRVVTNVNKIYTLT